MKMVAFYEPRVYMTVHLYFYSGCPE